MEFDIIYHLGNFDVRFCLENNKMQFEVLN